jgi:hypothetical protein
MFCQELRDGHEAYPGVAVYLSFEKHAELVVELTMDGARPTSERQDMKHKLGFHPTIELMKNDVNHNHIRI